MSIVSAIESLARKEAKNPVVLRTVHTAWEAALGAGIAAASGTHGDVRDVILVAVAAAAAAVKSAVVAAVEGRSVPAVAVEAPVPVVAAPPVVVVTGTDTPSTPASSADAGAVPPAAQ